MKTNILVADGRKLFREGLCALLEKHEDLHVAGEAEDARHVPRLLRALSAKVVILNSAPPSQTTPETIRAIVRARPEVRVIVLTFSAAAESVQELLDAGASACLTRECAAAELVAAVRRVRDGGIYLSSTLVERVVRRFVRPADARGDSGTSGASGAPAGASGTSDRLIPPVQRTLAPRERQILRRIAAGRTTKEIAAELGISTKTVETHRRRIMQKLDRHSVAELTKYAVLEGLSPLESPN